VEWVSQVLQLAIVIERGWPVSAELQLLRNSISSAVASPLRVDIYSNGHHELVLKAELPEMKEEEIDVTVEDNMLTLRGERKLDAEVTEDQFHRIERSYGSFVRTFSLPPTVDAGKVSAQYKDGVLTVRLPLREEAKPKQIKVHVAA
jgi:HSP20 family protein